MKTRIIYTLRVLFGLALFLGICYLPYWLLFDYKVRNVLAVGGIVTFFILPAFFTLLTVPRELSLILQVWTTKNPEVLVELIDASRKNGRL
jgi:uncharacterized membrane protein YhdT